MDLKPIYTEPENCQDCYKCVRECPVKAIQIEDNKAYIIEERCIYCGHCTQVCPTGAKKIRDGVSRTRLILQNYPRVILSLAPSWACEFEDLSIGQLIAAIRKLGFSGVSETAIGAELVSSRVSDYLQQSQPGVYISSACPVVVEYIRKYSTEHTPAITPMLSPMLAHARILKDYYGNDLKVIFAGPCICKKLEADHFKDLVEVAITFKDLKNWFEKENIHPEQLAPAAEDHFIPWQAGIGSLYPVEGGMLPGIDGESKKIVKMAFSDLSNIKDVIKNLDTRREKDTIFLELLACKGGCINGPAKLSQTSLAIKRYNIQQHRAAHPESTVPDLGHIDLTTTFKAYDCSAARHTEEEIKQALSAVGKNSPEDELNCSGCGYDSCRDFAVALVEGRAEENMCVSYMRRVAHDKATVLLQKIPAGVLLVDNDLKISDMNSSYYDLRGKIVQAERRIAVLTERGEMWAQYNEYKTVHKQLARVKPEKRELFEQRHSRELILYDAAARYLKELKDSGEEITPKAWQREIDLLTAQKQVDTIDMKAMREELKAVERLRKAADQLARQERDKPRDRGPER